MLFWSCCCFLKDALLSVSHLSSILTTRHPKLSHSFSITSKPTTPYPTTHITFRAQSPDAPTQTSLGHQCFWRQAYRLVLGFPAPEEVPGAQSPGPRPTTPPPPYSRFVASDPKARPSPYPLPNYAAPPVLCTLDRHTTHKPAGEKKSNGRSVCSDSATTRPQC